MTAPVDVLAVMACAAEEIQRYRASLGLQPSVITNPDIAESRVAVAELIEALSAFPETPNPYTYRIAYAKARAALARVGAK